MHLANTKLSNKYVPQNVKKAFFRKKYFAQ